MLCPCLLGCVLLVYHLYCLCRLTTSAGRPSAWGRSRRSSTRSEHSTACNGHGAAFSAAYIGLAPRIVATVPHAVAAAQHASGQWLPAAGRGGSGLMHAGHQGENGMGAYVSAPRWWHWGWGAGERQRHTGPDRGCDGGHGARTVQNPAPARAGLHRNTRTTVPMPQAWPMHGVTAPAPPPRRARTQVHKYGIHTFEPHPCAAHPHHHRACVPTSCSHAIVSSSVGPEYYVGILSFVDKTQLEPGCSVLLHNKVGGGRVGMKGGGRGKGEAAGAGVLGAAAQQVRGLLLLVFFLGAGGRSWDARCCCTTRW